MDSETRKKRIKYRSWHRGCKETDILLGQFCDARINQMHDAELDAFEALLEVDDADLYRWLTGELPVPDTMKHNPVLQALLVFEPQNG